MKSISCRSLVKRLRSRGPTTLLLGCRVCCPATTPCQPAMLPLLGRDVTLEEYKIFSSLPRHLDMKRAISPTAGLFHELMAWHYISRQLPRRHPRVPQRRMSPVPSLLLHHRLLRLAGQLRFRRSQPLLKQRCQLHTWQITLTKNRRYQRRLASLSPRVLSDLSTIVRLKPSPRQLSNQANA